MNNLPLYEEYKETALNRAGQLKSAWIRKEWGWLLGYFLIVLFILCVIVFGGITAVLSGISGLNNMYRYFFPIVENRIPIKTLIYEKIPKGKDDDGLYRTDFSIQIHSPAGNNQSTFRLLNSIEGDAECTLNQLGTIFQANGGIASTTDMFKASCITRTPIIDNGHLFTIEEKMSQK